MYVTAGKQRVIIFAAELFIQTDEQKTIHDGMPDMHIISGYGTGGTDDSKD